MATVPSPQPRLDFSWIQVASGKATQVFGQYMHSLDVVVRSLCAGNIGPLQNIGVSGSLSANDAAAAALGVVIGGLYRDSVGVVHVRTA